MLPFSIGFSELLLTSLVIFLLVGPEGLLQVARWGAKLIRSLRLMANDLREQINFDELKRELLSPVDELKNSPMAKELRDAQRELSTLRGDLNREARDLEREARGLPPASPPPPLPPSTPPPSVHEDSTQEQTPQAHTPQAHTPQAYGVNSEPTVDAPASPIPQEEAPQAPFPLTQKAPTQDSDTHIAQPQEDALDEELDEELDEGPVAALDPLDIVRQVSLSAPQSEPIEPIEPVEPPSELNDEPTLSLKVAVHPQPAPLTPPLINCPPMPFPLWEIESSSSVSAPDQATQKETQKVSQKGLEESGEKPDDVVSTPQPQAEPQTEPQTKPQPNTSASQKNKEEAKEEVKEEAKNYEESELPLEPHMQEGHGTLKEHLSELRARLKAWFKAFILLLIFSFIIHEQLYLLVTTPLYESLSRYGLETSIKFRTVNGPLYFYMKVCIISAVVLSVPVAFYQLWRYVSPGLYQHEQRAAKLFVGLSSLFFFMGVIFSYQVVVPFMFDYNLDFSRTQDDYKLLADITLEDYFDSFKMMILSIGVSFTTPILLAALSYVELLAYESLRSAWRWSTVGSFVVAAILTPPDYITQTLVALPLNGLYWVGVLLAFLIEKNREKG